MVQQSVRDLIKIEGQISELYAEKNKIIREIANVTQCKAPVIFHNEDNTWTRCTITDSLEKIEEGFFKTVRVERFSSKIEVLKNMPKELKGE